MGATDHFDRGPWRLCYAPGQKLKLIGLASDDFTHDVTLQVTGDFASESEFRAYLMKLMRALND